MKTKEEKRGKEEELPKKKELLSDEELLEVAAGAGGGGKEAYCLAACMQSGKTLKDCTQRECAQAYNLFI